MTILQLKNSGLDYESVREDMAKMEEFKILMPGCMFR